MATVRRIAYVGSYGNDDIGGGVTVFDRSSQPMVPLQRIEQPYQAGYLVWSDALSALFGVDERKTDGRGPVAPPANVFSFSVDRSTGRLEFVNKRQALGSYPTYLAIDPDGRTLVCVSHGSFDHVEQVVQQNDGTWKTEFLYDDSTIVAYGLGSDGAIGEVRSVVVLDGHGVDPNSSPQAGGHAQSSAHAHCAVFDPTGKYLVVCDKGNDAILVFGVGSELKEVSRLRFPEQTGPRHLVFDRGARWAFVTLEFSSEVATLSFDIGTGSFALVSRTSSVSSEHRGYNEPAEIRLHPDGETVYVNNRGEDSLAWFEVTDSGSLVRSGSVTLSPSLHPGVAARSFDLDRSGEVVILADRPGNCVRVYSVDLADRSLTEISITPIAEPAFVVLVDLEGAEGLQETNGPK